MLTLGSYIKNLRKQQGMTQRKLARLIGLSSAFISRLERDHFGDLSSHAVIKIAEALKVKPEELYFAAGFINEPKVESLQRKPEELLNELGLLIPLTIPIVDNIVKGEGEVVDYAYLAKSRSSGRPIKGVLVRGFSLEPGICEGDIIFIDTGLSPRLDDIVLCCYYNKVWIKKYEGFDCHLYGVVIEVSRRLR